MIELAWGFLLAAGVIGGYFIGKELVLYHERSEERDND